jgi:hypothetical protein
MKTFIVAMVAASGLCLAQPREEDPMNVRREGDRVFVENVPTLGWGRTGDTTFCGALAAAAKGMDVPCTYTSLMGDSALAFRVRWYRGTDKYPFCPSSPVGEFSPWDERAAKSIGVKLKYHVHLNQGFDMSRYADDIRASIDAGRPVLGYANKLDMGVIWGYDGAKQTFLFRDYYAGEKPLELPLKETKGLIAFVEKAGDAPPPRDRAIRAIRDAVADWTAKPTPAGEAKYLFGEAAYQEWIANLRDDKMPGAQRKQLFQPSWWTFCILADARSNARDYLRSIAPLFDAEPAARLQAAADLYAKSAALAYQPFGAKDAFFGPWSGKSIDDWTEPVRQREATILSEMHALDTKAIAELTAFLATIEQKPSQPDQ